MLLTLSTTHPPATDLSFLLHKHPDRFQSFDLSFDNTKHYFVGQDELEKLVEKGQGWLQSHPMKDMIARRFLKFQSSLYQQALSRLVDDDQPTIVDESTPVHRHPDHRFEWSRKEFRDWAGRVGDRFGYTVTYLPVGPEDGQVGSPTQMGVFKRD